MHYGFLQARALGQRRKGTGGEGLWPWLEKAKKALRRRWRQIVGPPTYHRYPQAIKVKDGGSIQINLVHQVMGELLQD